MPIPPAPIRLAARVLLGAALAVLPAAGHAQPSGTLRVAWAGVETSFDPPAASDTLSDGVISNVFEAMLGYDYLARPAQIVPLTLEAMPTVSDDGRTWTCRLRKGIFFATDPAFRGAKRELVAADYAYAIKRLLDPAVRSPWQWIVDGKLVGGNEARAAAVSSGRFAYDAPMPGLEVVDRYTLRIRLVQPDLRFSYILAMPATAAVAREVVEAHGTDIGAHPVGTGPYVLAEYQRATRVVLVANPAYRGDVYTPAGPVPAASQPVAAALRGKPLPRVARVEIRVIEEGQSRWLAFRNRELDLLDGPGVPADFADQAIVAGKLAPDLAKQGVTLHTWVRPAVAWSYFNMEHPVLGGYTPDRIALRRAIAMGYDEDAEIRMIRKGRGMAAQGIVPPGVVGHDPGFRSAAQRYDPAAARALLDRYGYRDRDGDGYREQPDGSPLVLERWSSPTSAGRQLDELWKRSMDAIGIRIVFRKERAADTTKASRQGRVPFAAYSWTADFPDAENFLQLLYGPNAGQDNTARFRLPEYDRLFDEMRRLPDSPARTAIVNRMTELVIAYAPWRLEFNPIVDHLSQPWVRNHVPHPILTTTWRFLDVSPARATR